MKFKLTKLIVFAFMALASASALGQTIKYKSTRVHSGSGTVNEPHIITFAYSHSNDACDTVYIDRQPFYVLINGDYGEQISVGSKKWKYSRLFIGVKDTGTGRGMSFNSGDINTKIYLNYTGELRTSPIESVSVFIHGLSATYYK